MTTTKKPKKGKQATPRVLRICPGCGRRLRPGVKVSFCEATGKVLEGVVYERRQPQKKHACGNGKNCRYCKLARVHVARASHLDARGAL